MEKTVGVLGGMGPEATVMFFGELVALTPARCDQDHLRIMVYNDPKIPDRTRHLVYSGPTPLPHLIKGLQSLEAMGSEVIAIPCNTAHAYFSELCGAVSVPILHIARETVGGVERRLNIPAKVAVLGTEATVSTRLYHDELERRGYQAVEIPVEIQKKVSQVIDILKGKNRRDEARQLMGQVYQYFSGGKADGIVLACTELGLANPDCAIPRFDSLKLLAEGTVRFARSGG